MKNISSVCGYQKRSNEHQQPVDGMDIFSTYFSPYAILSILVTKFLIIDSESFTRRHSTNQTQDDCE